MKLTTSALALAFLASTTAFAQTATTVAPSKPIPESNKTINERKVNQQDRIAQGVKSGQLTAGETGHLEHQEAAINHEEKNMRAQDNGHLTKQDRKTLDAQQNQESRRIYRDKHNARRR